MSKEYQEERRKNQTTQNDNDTLQKILENKSTFLNYSKNRQGI